ncbi:hypothetical protein A9Q98_07820 [Thalassotalea sp. 42_200_T64]|nr:hypothetical protein A9Q98_07820 [Thalassotalea sp. 42_200_T64]
MKQPHHQVLIKFALLGLLLASYFGYLTYEYDLLTGWVAALVTWSFFVLCTPVADAGFLLDLPLRLLFGIRMVVSEIAVWAIAILINVIAFIYFKEYYQTTLLTRLMEAIITTPYPFWAVVVLSGIGTFLSIRFGDELMDVIHHKDRNFYHSHHFKHEMILFAFFLVVIFGYYELISSLGISLEHQ